MFWHLCACVSVYGFCYSFQPQLGHACSETPSSTPGGDVSGRRMCYVHFPPAVMADSASLLQPRGLDAPLSGLHCELLSLSHNKKCLVLERRGSWTCGVFTVHHQFTRLEANYFQSYPTVELNLDLILILMVGSISV